MWVFFVKAMARLPTVTAVVVNTSGLTPTLTRWHQDHSTNPNPAFTPSPPAANVGASAFLGWLLFGEPLPFLWWVGVSLMILGVSLVVTEETLTEETAQSSKEREMR
jgi:drug/metabolite transporter (DMT)-like permease